MLPLPTSIFLVLLAILSSIQCIQFFPPSFSNAPRFLFLQNRLYDVTQNTRMNLFANNTIHALGDFNNDKLFVSFQNEE